MKSSIRVRTFNTDRDRNLKNDGKRDQDQFLRNQKCNIPKLDINGSEVIHFFQKHEPLKCQTGQIEEDWIKLDENDVIRFSKTRKDATCSIQYFWFETDHENTYGEWIEVKDGDKFEKSDFANVWCRQFLTIWKSVLWTIQPKKTILNRKKTDKKQYNIYFLGFDSLSQMSFRRKLPKTVKFLEETLGSVVLNGYNIVGDGTPQAFIPILTGQTETELPLTRKRYEEASYLDDVYPLIWKNYSDAGYVTMFGEDMHLYATFTYRLKGFRKQPTDHYPKTFYKEIERLGERTCLNAEPLHKIWFKNAAKFMNVYQSVPRFVLMHQGLLSHDEINLVDVQDDDLTSHLMEMHNSGHFDDSIVIVMADHGHRFAKLRDTHQGQLEERLPFFSIALPKELRGGEMEKNLRDNKEKLTSPFDIHASLLDILNLNSDKDHLSQRSLSLFRPIPSDRTCSQAGIEAHWCTCLSWKDAMENEQERALTKRIAQGVVDAINKEVSVEKDLCAPLSLAKIINAKKLLPDKNLLAYKNVKDTDGFVPDLSGSTEAAFAHYQLKIQTTPGIAIYEVTLFYDAVKDEVQLDFGSISHVNKYGDTPHCVIDKNFFLATFCVCYDRV